MYKFLLKKVLDFLVSIVLMFVLSPVFFIVSLTIFITNGRKVFFLQERIGLNNKVFKVIKFVTMSKLADESGTLLPDNLRITKLGRFLRATSIDELPQLINIAKGDMSLVGPRPLLTKYLPLYDSDQLRRHEVKPGITGWAQVNGRNKISWQEKFKLDLWYVDNISFWVDFKILLLTVQKVLLHKDINSGGINPMETFTGNN